MPAITTTTPNVSETSGYARYTFIALICAAVVVLVRSVKLTKGILTHYSATSAANTALDDPIVGNRDD